MTNARILAAAAALVSFGCTSPAELPRPPESDASAPYDGVAFPNRRSPITIPPKGAGLVTDSLSDTVSVVDLGAAARTATLPVGRDPVGVDGPTSLAIDVAHGFAYVLLAYPVAYLGPHAGHAGTVPRGFVQKLALSDLRVLGGVEIDFEPTAMALSDDGSRLVIAHRHDAGIELALDNPRDLDFARGRLAIVDPDAIDPVLSPDPDSLRVCVAARGLALSPHETARAYVTCFGEDAIAVVDLSNQDAEPKRFAVGPAPGAAGMPNYGPNALALSPDGGTLAFANDESSDVRFFDVDEEQVAGDPIPLSRGRALALEFSKDGAELYVVTREPDALVVLEAKPGGVEIGRRELDAAGCASPANVVASPSGALLVACSGDGRSPGRLLTLDDTTLAVLSTVDVGLGPTAVTVAGGAAR